MNLKNIIPPLLGRVPAGTALFAFLAAVLPTFAFAKPEPAFTGRKLLYVLNLGEVERFRNMVPPRPERLKLQEDIVADDRRAIAWLKGLGFAVVVTDEHSPAEMTQGMDLVLIAESVSANEIQGKYKQVPVPVLVLENDLYDDMGLTGKKLERDFGTAEKERFVWLVQAPHPLAGGLGAGVQNVYQSATKMNWGRPGPGAGIIATIAGETDKAVLFAYEKGATMDGENIAPARRIGFFMHENCFGLLRPEGLALLQAALNWAVSPPGQQTLR